MGSSPTSPAIFHGNKLKNLVHHSQFLPLKNEVKNNYHDFIVDLNDDLNEGYQSPYFSDVFFREIGPILKSNDLKNFSPDHLYWAQCFEQLITIIQLHEEAQELRKSQANDELELIQEDIFNFWNAHEHSHLFVDFIQQGNEPEAASLELIPLLENQLLSFYYLHLTKDPFVSDSPLIYQAVPERGDGDLGIKVGDNHFVANFDLKKTDGLFSFSRVDHQQKILEVQNSEEDIFLVSFDKKAPKISYEGFELNYLSICEQGEATQDKQIKRIEQALSLIHEFSPDCFSALKNFTHSIIPITDTGVVSFSLQSLPGYSSLNLFERDNIDLLDDLIHENGHHYLNVHLNQTELINEDDEEIFYSPWRRAFRPIRGLYHAYLTFAWALKLFVDIAHHPKFQTTFSQKEVSKISLRALEEYEMLCFCHSQLEKAFDLEKITDEGMELYQQFQLAVETAKSSMPQLEAHLFDKDKRELEDLKDHLQQVSKKYQL